MINKSNILQPVLLFMSLNLSPILASNEYDLRWLMETNQDGDEKMCWYRNNHLPEEVFPLYSGYGCYSFNDAQVFKNNTPLLAGACYYDYKNRSIVFPCAEGSVPFLPTFEDVYIVIAASFKKSSYAERWRRCFSASIDCCRKTAHNNTLQDPSHCPAMWDGWDCWNSTPEGSIQYNYCKEYVYTSDKPPKCNHPCLKQCFSRNKTMTEATWNITSNYQGCSTRSRLAFRYLYHVGLLSLSTLSSIPAVIIFFSYRRLRITRIALHRNLLIANIFRCSMAILQKVFVTYEALNTQNDDESLMDKNGTGCKILAVLVLISANSMFAMMLLEAVFLHRLIAAAFKAEPNMKILYCFASVVTIFPVVAWIILRATKENTDCWSTDDAGYQWINDGTRITLLAINTLLMADIIRVLLTKLKAVKSWHSDKIRRTVRSTLFLLPLFGVTVLFAAVRPDTTSCAWEQAYYIISYTMDGMQGPLVAILYCYFNREVRMMLKKTYSNMSENITFLHLGVSEQRIPRNGPRTTSMTNVDDPTLEISKMRNSLTESKTTNLTDPTNSSSESTHKVNFHFNDLFHSSRSSHTNINKPRASMFGRRSTLASISELRESVEEGSQNNKSSVSDSRFSVDNCQIPEPSQTKRYDDSTILSDASHSNITQVHKRIHKKFDNTWNMFSVDKVPPRKLSNNESLIQNRDEKSKKQSNIFPSRLRFIENDSHSRDETSNASESFIDINDQTIDEIDTSSQLGSENEGSSLSEISEIKSRPRVSDKEIEEFGNLYVSLHGPNTTKC